MVINSRLYECTVSHSRKVITENKFYYKYFMFYLDLDEIDNLSSRLVLFSRNRFNVFNFRDQDHLVFDKPDVKRNILKYIRENGVEEEIKRIQLLTNVATFGYNFNPVSFYFCFDKDDKPICVVPEVGNTFGELKPFFIDKENLHDGQFRARMQKNFYVSPFINHDVFFDFQLSVPDNKLNIKIDDYKEGNRIFTTHLSGKSSALTDLNLMKYAVKYPLVTLKVIGAIHWQAIKLILKKVHYFKKNEYLNLQKGALTKWKK
ncbi:MAG: DUF1365 domain-containing protein [Ignavibacteriales bacterium]|nr:DUF1365 domain-containing protein [Ignavibacteriales bacterium]